MASSKRSNARPENRGNKNSNRNKNSSDGGGPDRPGQDRHGHFASTTQAPKAGSYPTGSSPARSYATDTAPLPFINGSCQEVSGDTRPLPNSKVALELKATTLLDQFQLLQEHFAQMIDDIWLSSVEGLSTYNAKSHLIGCPTGAYFNRWLRMVSSTATRQLSHCVGLAFTPKIKEWEKNPIVCLNVSLKITPHPKDFIVIADLVEKDEMEAFLGMQNMTVGEHSIKGVRPIKPFGY